MLPVLQPADSVREYADFQVFRVNSAVKPYNIIMSIICYLRVGVFVFFSFFHRMNWGPVIRLFSPVLVYSGPTVPDGKAVG